MDFIAFKKILNMNNLTMCITQKLHGTNGQIFINDNKEVFIGSRNRWLDSENDNHGFYKWVMQRKDEIVNALGQGRHYGEFVGKGIANSEGLAEKTFVLFNHWIFQEKPMPEYLKVVPVLYKGLYSQETIKKTMEDLKQGGSQLVNGYMNVEGIVIEIRDCGTFKMVFQEEETQWVRSAVKKKENFITVKVDRLLQPIRLEKLFLRDSNLLENYPKNFFEVIKAYCEDLIAENQMTAEFYEENKNVIHKAVASLIKKG